MSSTAGHSPREVCIGGTSESIQEWMESLS